MTKLSLILAALIFAGVTSAPAQEAPLQNERDAFSNSIQNALSDGQKQELQNAQTWQEKKQLLNSWGLRPGFDFANLDPQTKAKLRELRAQLKVAQTVEQRAEIRSQIRALFKSAKANSNNGPQA